MKKFYSICIICITLLVYFDTSYSKPYSEGSVGWYLKQSRNTKDLLMIGIIKGFRMAEYIHEYSLKEKNETCPVGVIPYPIELDYASIIKLCEEYMLNNQQSYDLLIEDIVSMVFYILSTNN